jgi:hypothetical protein
MEISKWFCVLKFGQKLSDFTDGVSHPFLYSNTAVILFVGYSKEHCTLQEGSNIEE